MDNEQPYETDATEAFERLSRKLGLLHSAIEGLTAARERAPDYSATLGTVVEGLRSLDVRLQAIEHSRALSLSPVALVEEINAAAEAVRLQDRRILAESREALSRSLGQVDGMIARGRSVTGRVRRERWIASGGVLAGVLLGLIMPGAIVRALPEDWHAPEWMAARIMGMERAEAGKKNVRNGKTHQTLGNDLSPLGPERFIAWRNVAESNYRCAKPNACEFGERSCTRELLPLTAFRYSRHFGGPVRGTALAPSR